MTRRQLREVATSLAVTVLGATILAFGCMPEDPPPSVGQLDQASQNNPKPDEAN